jgi:asparagine synthase (glutamine-hydrolysing)
MCGIAAIFAYGVDAPRVGRDELVAIRDHMIARGPDGCGEYVAPDGRLGLGHRRLAILDLSDAGAQPMWNADQTLCIVFNGEIYNFQSLRNSLAAEGCVFRSKTDTEVLLHLYARKGADMVQDLRGMFAFAIWDARRHSLFLARDPFGIKPLYYADDGRTIRVASQVKALLHGGHIDACPEPAGHVGYFLWGHVPDPFTFYRGIKALPAGHILTVSATHSASSSTLSPRSYCSIPNLLRDCADPSRNSGRNGAQESKAGILSLREALRDSIAHHLVSDVPVGVFLSAGLDSSTIASLVSEIHPDVRTVTLGFDEYRNSELDEVPLAEQVAAACRTRHQTIWVTQKDFENSASEALRAMDQPSIDGVNTYFVSMAARRAGLKVALSGVGGDELFGGYPSFRDVPRMVGALQPFENAPSLGRAVRVVSRKFVERMTSPKYAGLLEYGPTCGGAYLLRRSLFMPWELTNLLHPDVVRAGWEKLQPMANLHAATDGTASLYACVMALELQWYMRHQLLRDSDWAGMAHSLEIRVPFVDAHLLRSLVPALCSGHAPTKQDMARTPRSPLPASVLSRPKSGFTVPVRDWMMNSFDPLSARERGLRGWSREVYSRFTDHLEMHRLALAGTKATLPRRCSPERHHRILVLLTDGFGGFGGISKFNRDFLTALCSHPAVSEVFAVPRLMPHDPGPTFGQCCDWPVAFVANGASTACPRLFADIFISFRSRKLWQKFPAVVFT